MESIRIVREKISGNGYKISWFALHRELSKEIESFRNIMISLFWNRIPQKSLR